MPRQQHCSQPFCIQPLLCDGSTDLGSGLLLPAALPSLDTNEEAKELQCLWPAGRAPKQAAHPLWRSELCPAALPQFQQPGAWSKGCSCCFCSTGTRWGQGGAHRRAAAALHLPCLRDKSMMQMEPAVDSFTACGPALLCVLPSTPCSFRARSGAADVGSRQPHASSCRVKGRAVVADCWQPVWVADWWQGWDLISVTRS